MAERLLAPYFADDGLAGVLPAICRDALDLPVPVLALDERTQLLELFHGPTAAFKDFGARFLAACLARVRGADEPPITILVATSGDTGSAVAAAFHRRPGFRVAILYPEGRVSPRRAHQLGCLGEKVHAFRVAGSFEAGIGYLLGVDLDKALQQRGLGGESRYDRLVGRFTFENDRIKLDDVVMAAGALRATGALDSPADGNVYGRLRATVPAGSARLGASVGIQGTRTAPKYTP